VKNVKGEPKWLLATVTEKIGSVMYRVQVKNESWKRHADQILVRKTELIESADYSSEDISDEVQEAESEQVAERDQPAVDNFPFSTPTKESHSRSPVARDQSSSELVQVPVAP